VFSGKWPRPAPGLAPLPLLSAPAAADRGLRPRVFSAHRPAAAALGSTGVPRTTYNATAPSVSLGKRACAQAASRKRLPCSCRSGSIYEAFSDRQRHVQRPPSFFFFFSALSIVSLCAYARPACPLPPRPRPALQAAQNTKAGSGGEPHVPIGPGRPATLCTTEAGDGNYTPCQRANQQGVGATAKKPGALALD
jgi:hypothetical protein